jgi:hypothetical protein
MKHDTRSRRQTAVAPLRIAVIGLDTSHAIEFPRRMQAPDCQPDLRVEGLRTVSCLRFPTPFTDEATLANRQRQLQDWGVKVTEHFAEAVADCDAIMLEINDPAYHLAYFERCLALKKPIFLDKPLADTLANASEIIHLARQNHIPLLSASSLRFAAGLLDACQTVPQPAQATIYGPLGIPPAGEGLVWYGVHAFEMLQRAMGRGAISIDARRDAAGVVSIVTYPDKRRGIVELTTGVYTYGGTLRHQATVCPFQIDSSRIYTEELTVIRDFFRTGQAPLEWADSLEVMALLEGAVRSSQNKEPVLLESELFRNV